MSQEATDVGYKRFVRKVKLNPSMYALPSSVEMRETGYGYDERGYIIGPDGARWNTEIVNPGILPEKLRRLFGEAPPPEQEPESPMGFGPEGVPDLRPESLHGVQGKEKEPITTRICDECKQELPLDAFRRFRGGARLSVCKECAKKKREETKKKMGNPKTPPVSQQKTTGWISKQRAKELVSEAYRRGYADGMKDAVPEETEVTLDELLEVADENT